eukprot:TRINITY_DN13152_c0_g1_i1.p1 TRINITY_DN13152_c0_g1~~TRINITY_DN13152_c0_g1_i1.p1  ORF type:complete len:128 (+),score=11.04 TRINITY_DN13152_c0_g1_i1:55-438(+)
MNAGLADDSRAAAVQSLMFLLSCNVIHMYFLDWNFVTLTTRSIQLFCVYKVRKQNEFARKIIFIMIVIGSNLPILVTHMFYRGVQPFILMFVGQVVISRVPTILFNDLIIILLESVIVYHPKYILGH